MKCVIDDCEGKAVGWGYCQKHYVRVKKYGSPHAKKRDQSSLEDRFWRFVTKGNEFDCWEWQGQRLSNGYGRISLGAKIFGSDGAHRVSWRIANKQEIPAGMFVMHKCDNPCCVNPNHLTIGTPKENVADMIAKGRKRVVSPKGEGNGKSLLDAEKVRIIRESTLDHTELGRQLGVSPNCIRGVRTGRTWSHIV